MPVKEENNGKMPKGEKSMKITQLKKVLSFILCVVLVAAMALISMGCNDNGAESSVPTNTQGGEGEKAEVTEVGEGAVEFNFNVVDKDGKVVKFLVKTDEKTVGAALLKESLIEGEDSQYGLYVKTVNGNTLDFDKDGKFWAFYIDGKMAPSGVDTTEIEKGAIYEFKAE